MASEAFDAVVIGAGLHGIIAAKTYVQVDPNIKLLIVDAASTIGGTWSEERLYDGLKTNNFVGNYEFSDLAMPGKQGVHTTGQVVHDYLKGYADKFDLTRRIRFNTKVEVVERVQDNQWRLTAVSTANSLTPTTPMTIICDKLIVATGLTSDPFIPKIPGDGSFDAPIVHSKTLGEYAPSLLKSASSVTVYGAKKSAHDTVHLFASQGIKVNWVIRKSSGSGPGWLASTKPMFPGASFDQVPFVRALTWMSPCIWGDADGFGWIRGFLNGTRLGRWVLAGFWSTAEKTLVQDNGYDTHPKLQKLKPWCGPFWSGASAGALNFSTDFFELVKSDKVDIHIADISRITSKTIHLPTGEFIPTDALICCTGWYDTPPFKVLPEGIEGEMGLPYPLLKADALVAKADKEISQRFPILAAQPSMYKAEPKTNPFRLYRFIAPPTDTLGRSIVFMGIDATTGTAMCGELQALWAVAYLTGKLVLDKKTPEERARSGRTSFEDERLWETVLSSRFGRWRSPAGYGGRFPDMIFEGLPYQDLLLRDLGMKYRRKGSLWRELFTPYTVRDYKGLVDEWMVTIGSASPTTRTY
ncbi:hypothetical protein FRB95_002886 [Tulasnella sp. JGI-2019a]|nr:hypothetical protein FRB95_002886 [Tulasnella sp. JGI-2019a]